MVNVKRPKAGWGSNLSERQQSQYKAAKSAEHEAVKNTRSAQASGDESATNKAIKHELSSADHAAALRKKHEPKED